MAKKAKSIATTDPTVAVIAGLGTLILGGFLLSWLSIQRISQAAQGGPQVFQQFLRNTADPFGLVLTLAGFALPLAAGFVTGYLVKKDGLKYGAIVGLIAFLFPVVLSLLLNFLPQAPKFSTQNLLPELKLIALTALGGWLGTRARQ